MNHESILIGAVGRVGVLQLSYCASRNAFVIYARRLQTSSFHLVFLRILQVQLSVLCGFYECVLIPFDFLQ